MRAVKGRRGVALVLLALILAAIVGLWLRVGTRTTGNASPDAGGATSASATAENASAAQREEALVRALWLLPGESTASRDEETATFQGHVISRADGSPVAGAELVFEGAGGATTVRSRDDGAFQLSIDRDGTLTLAMAQADGFFPAYAGLILSARRGKSVRGLVLELVPDPKREWDAAAPPPAERAAPAGSASLEGKVTRTGTSEPVPTFSVVLFRRTAAMSAEHLTTGTFADATGAFAIRNVAAGDYEVRVAASGYLVSAPRSISLREGAITRADFTLGASCQVSGTLRSESDGRPIVGARISLEAGGDIGVGMHNGTLSDARGRFSVATIEAGPSSVTISAPNHHGRILTRACGDAGDVMLARVAEGEKPRLELTGIGTVLRTEGDTLVIATLIPGGGAEAAGLAPGDRVLTVDGEPVESLGYRGTIERIRGPEGSTVSLLVSRGKEPARTLEVERKRVRY